MKDLYLLGRLSHRAHWCLISAPGLVADSLLSELNSAQKCQVEDGSQVVVTENIEGKPWPRIKVYRLVDASPEQVAAVFFDYESAKSFVPNVIKSEISNRLSACTMDVDYGLDVPIFPDEFYTVRNNLRLIDDNSYCIDWKLLRSVLTKDSVGNIPRRAMGGKGRHLLSKPGYAGIQHCRIVARPGHRADEGDDQSPCSKVEKEKSANPPGLKRQVAALRAALRQPPAAELDEVLKRC